MTHTTAQLKKSPASAADRDTLHFLTCGHVDDGKSTLIGRLLYEINAVPDDQLKGAMVDGKLDYSRLTDGLEDERAQGITIDVAYRYFRHDGRHYRIADTPGHVQYTRNMAVAAVGSECALILVDASHGVREQTIRHSRIAALLGVRHFCILVNKMDLANYSRKVFEDIERRYRDALQDVAGISLTFIPVSAIAGDNVATGGDNMPWYQGKTLLGYLSTLDVAATAENGARLPIQSMVRLGEQRGYHGLLSGGSLKAGDRLSVARSGEAVTIAELYHSGRQVQEVCAGQAITLVPVEDVDISRGSVLKPADQEMPVSDALLADVIWLDSGFAAMDNLQAIVKIHHREAQAEIDVIRKADGGDNPVAKTQIFTAAPLSIDAFADNPSTGLFLIIWPETEATIGVGIVTAPDGKEWNFSI